jgi:DNA polymerase-3 subunit epsilon
VRLTDEAFPRLSIVRSVAGDAAHLGPMRGAGDAKLAIEALHELGGVRTCTTRLPRLPRATARACLLADLGTCSAPCLHGEASGYGDVADALRAAIVDDPSPVVAALAQRIAEFAERLEFERASALRDGVSALVAGAAEAQRLAALRRVTIVAARKVGAAWEVAVVIRGRLAGTASVGDGAGVAGAAARILAEDGAGPDSAGPDRSGFAGAGPDRSGFAGAGPDRSGFAGAGPDRSGFAGAGPGRAAGAARPLIATPLVEEQRLVAEWLERPGTRLVSVEGEWAQPVYGAARHERWMKAQREDREMVWDAYAR